jgi:RNA polymerase sigma-70 factor (ECF subfamily)
MTVVLDTLSPAERLAYVLRDVFAVPFEQIAPVLGRSEVATRQLASRARRRLREPEPREDLAAADAAVVDAFMQASRDNDFAALLDLLDPEATVRVDDAALAMGGDARAVQGQQAVAEFFAGRARAALPATLDGAAAASWQHLGEVKVVFGFTVVDDKVVQIEVLADPRVLTRAARRSPAR